MAFTHYVDFDCQGPDQEDCAFHVAQIVSSLHLAIVTECGEGSNSQNKVAVAFPQAQGERGGGVVRLFFANEEVAGRLLRHPNLHRYGSTLSTPLSSVPETSRYQKVKRYRKVDRMSPTRLRRAARKGRPTSYSVLCYEDRVAALQKIEENVELGFAVYIKSHSTGRPFVLQILQKEADCCEGSFNAYGLCQDGVVPVF